MRVAYVSRAPFISGAERSLQTMLRYLPRAGVEPVVVGPGRSELSPWCEAHGIPFLACPLAVRDKWHPLRWWSSVRAMNGLLRRHRIDLVHSNQLWTYPAAGAAALDLGLARVCHIRDEVSPAALRWYCSQGVDAVVCISRHIEGQVSSGWRPDRPRPVSRTLLNPVTLPELLDPASEAAARRAARRRFEVPDEAVVLGFIGQIRPVKGLLELIEALAGLAGDPRWRLLVAGHDPHPGASHEQECRRRAAAAGLGHRVNFLGFLGDVGPFYRAIDLAVVPSLEEPLGRVPLEAAAHARPSLASAVGGLPETIEAGETGWLVPPGDVEALRAALAAFLGCPSREAGRAARRRAEALADPDKYCDNILNLYKELLN
jgi:glycosyltransferase involved in cell wall biosynthesis